MNRLLKVTLLLATVLVLVAAAGVSYLYAKYPEVPPAANITVVSTPEKVARGEYLSNHVTGCVICHAEPDYTKYGRPVKPRHARRGRRVLRRRIRRVRAV
jgi:cytochrome c553